MWHGNYDFVAVANLLLPSPPRYCVLTGHLRLWHRRTALLWSGSKNPEPGVLAAGAPGKVTRRRWPVAGAEFHILRIDDNDITFVRAFPQSGLWRVNLSNGLIVWQRN